MLINHLEQDPILNMYGLCHVSPLVFTSIGVLEKLIALCIRYEKLVKLVIFSSSNVMNKFILQIVPDNCLKSSVYWV